MHEFISKVEDLLVQIYQQKTTSNSMKKRELIKVANDIHTNYKKLSTHKCLREYDGERIRAYKKEMENLVMRIKNLVEVLKSGKNIIEECKRSKDTPNKLRPKKSASNCQGLILKGRDGKMYISKRSGEKQDGNWRWCIYKKVNFADITQEYDIVCEEEKCRRVKKPPVKKERVIKPNRISPVEHANEYKNKIRKGLDGNLWISEKRGNFTYYRWWPYKKQKTQDISKQVDKSTLQCKGLRKTKSPKCNDQPNCKWKTGVGCIDNEESTIAIKTSDKIPNKPVNLDDRPKMLNIDERIRFRDHLIRLMNDPPANACIDDIKQFAEIKYVLGSGDFGQVVEACSPNNRQCDFNYAIKMGKKDEESIDEVNYLKLLKTIVEDNISPNVPLMLANFKCDNCQFLGRDSFFDEFPCDFMFFEIANGDLKHFFKNQTNLTKDIIDSCLFQLMAGVESYQTKYEICNRDLKTENILVYKIREGGYFSYRLSSDRHDETFYVPNYGYLFVISDFGVATTYSLPEIQELEIYDEMRQKEYDIFTGMRVGIIEEDESINPLVNNDFRSGLKFDDRKLSDKNTFRVNWSHSNITDTRVIPVYSHIMNLQFDNSRKMFSELTNNRFKLLPSMNMVDVTLEDIAQTRYYMPPFSLSADTQDIIKIFLGGWRSRLFNGDGGSHTRHSNIYSMLYDDLHHYMEKTIVPTDNYTYHLLKKSQKKRKRDEKDLYEFTLSLNPAKSFARFFILDYFNDTYKTRPSSLTQMGRIFESNY